MAAKEKIVPMPGMAVVKVDEKAKESEGGIVIPSTAVDRRVVFTATVIEVGDGERHENGSYDPVPFKKGDRVLFPNFAGNDFDFHGTKLRVLRQEEVLAVLC